jgi:hypothetical protein
MPVSHRLVYLLFLPASIGLLGQLLAPGPLDQRLLALGFVLLAADQARMAALDLANIHTLQGQVDSLALRGLAQLTQQTILWELIGFYTGVINLGWGIILVLSSQVYFNALASYQLKPGIQEPLQPKPLGERGGLVLANGGGIVLMLLWLARVMPLTIVLGLWAIALVYAGGKLLQSISLPRMGVNSSDCG